MCFVWVVCEYWILYHQYGGYNDWSQVEDIPFVGSWIILSIKGACWQLHRKRSFLEKKPDKDTFLFIWGTAIIFIV